MTDLIKREDAIKAIVERFMMNRSYAERMLEDIPSAEKQGEWIPCSERLPEGESPVLVNVIARDRTFDIILCLANSVEEYYAKGWINAWMPLPEPWKGADDE